MLFVVTIKSDKYFTNFILVFTKARILRGNMRYNRENKISVNNIDKINTEHYFRDQDTRSTQRSRKKDEGSPGGGEQRSRNCVDRLKIPVFT